MEPAAADLGSEERFEHALEIAYRHLARRDRTEAEVRRRLEDRDVDTGAIEAALNALRDRGHVDDAGYARRFAEDRRTLDEWGRERIERRLRQVGVPEEHVATAIGARDPDGERDAAREVLRRRYPGGLPDPAARRRALGVLVRKGHDLEIASDAVRAHAFGTAGE